MSFDSLEVPKELCAIIFLIDDWSYLFVNTWTPDRLQCIKTWSQLDFCHCSEYW